MVYKYKIDAQKELMVSSKIKIHVMYNILYIFKKYYVFFFFYTRHEHYELIKKQNKNTEINLASGGEKTMR